jgi:uncharacterized FAD-dependent dehydrogenase
MSEPTRTWRLLGLEWELRASDDELRRQAARHAGVEPEVVRGFRIARKSLDARFRGGRRRMRFVGHVDLMLDAGVRTEALKKLLRKGRASEPLPPETLAAPAVHPSLALPQPARVAIVGAGPAGLAAALVLAESGIPATIVERGPQVGERSRRLVRFHRHRQLDPDANLLFGEGGAGTYSDGKIYTRVDDPLEVPLLEALVEAGAPPAIAYDSLAHIGTDRLHRMLPRIRARLEAGGIRFVWNTRMEGIRCDAGAPRRVQALRTTAGEIPCDALILAPGHSARETWRQLDAAGVPFEARPFQLGLRIEHPQELIDRGRYGDGPDSALLGAASYNLVSRAQGSVRAAHSFCMCPGGRIVASVHEEGVLCTNGMSNSTHSSPWATSAIVTTMGPADFGQGPFDGVEFQARLERAAFHLGGGDYTAPAQTAADFLAGRITATIRETTWPFGTVGARLDELVPPLVRDALGRALRHFDRALPGFAGETGLFVGIETRSSGPIRIPRDEETLLADGFANLRPVGEGAGWAGGIMSAMIDGARAARSLAARGLP